MIKRINKSDYKDLIKDISQILDQGRRESYKAINNILVQTYWEIGKRIVEFEQHGKISSKYGSKLLIKLSIELSPLGQGFSRTNLVYMRLFYIKYQKSETLSHQLSWSHYFELLKINDDRARNFYEKQSIEERWSVRELKRQKKSMLFKRISVNKNSGGILDVSKSRQTIKKAQDIIRDPYILEFLGIPENYQHSEKELEQAIIDNLQMFLLELGKGFTFVSRQFRITLNNRHFYADLVFYHRILKCFVVIDLKIGEVNYKDIGQMNMYLNYFSAEKNIKGDNEPIGIVLSTQKEHISVQYALGGISNNLFVSKYQLHLPKKEELEREVKKLI